MYKRSDYEQRRVDLFLQDYFGEGFVPEKLSKEEAGVVDQVVKFVSDNFGKMKYILGLGIDFAMLAQALANVDNAANAFQASLTEKDLFTRYELITERAGKAANTLSVKYKKASFGIRKFEEKVGDLFNEMDRTGYPSAYVYNTGQWHKYKPELLLPCFQLSKSGRFQLCQKLIDLALEKLTMNRFFGRETQRVRLFERIIREYSRSHSDEISGAVLQGIAYGYCHAGRPHLSLVVDKVRTGSSRQRRFGDIDGYSGIDLDLSVEVKDQPITKENCTVELGEFLTKVATNKILGLAFVLSADKEATAEIERAGARTITQTQLLEEVARWDWTKQNQAVLGLLHYLSHVEQEPDAVIRLLKFIKTVDPKHDCLAYLASQ